MLHAARISLINASQKLEPLLTPTDTSPHNQTLLRVHSLILDAHSNIRDHLDPNPALPTPHKDYHVVPDPNGWAVKQGGDTHPSSIHPTDTDAIDRGRTMARFHRTKLLLHDRDGRLLGTIYHPPTV